MLYRNYLYHLYDTTNNIVIIHIIDMILQIIHALTYQQLRDSIHSHAKPPAVGLLAQYITIHILLYTDYYTYRLLHIQITTHSIHSHAKPPAVGLLAQYRDDVVAS